MKNNMILLWLFVVGIGTTHATQLVNSTNFPAQVKVVYNKHCGTDSQSDFAEYGFVLPASKTIDITPKSGIPSDKKKCDLSILSIKVTITFPDGVTEISRIWFANPSAPFGNFVTIGSGYPANASLSKEVLWLK